MAGVWVFRVSMSCHVSIISFHARMGCYFDAMARRDVPVRVTSMLDQRNVSMSAWVCVQGSPFQQQHTRVHACISVHDIVCVFDTCTGSMLHTCQGMVLGAQVTTLSMSVLPSLLVDGTGLRTRVPVRTLVRTRVPRTYTVYVDYWRVSYDLFIQLQVFVSLLPLFILGFYFSIHPVVVLELYSTRHRTSTRVRIALHVYSDSYDYFL